MGKAAAAKAAASAGATSGAEEQAGEASSSGLEHIQSVAAGELVEKKAEGEKALATGEEPSAKDLNEVVEGYLSKKIELRKLTPQQEAQIKASIDKIPPETRKALQQWVKSGSDDTGSMIAMNCLVFIFLLGVFLMVSSYLIAVHEINIYEVETWSQGKAFAMEKHRVWRVLPKVRVPVTAEL